MNLFFTAVALFFVARSPQYAAMHTVDMLLLFVGGVSFGVGLMGIIQGLRGRTSP